MSIEEEEFPGIPEEVMEYLLEQKLRERDLTHEKEELKTRLDKIEEQLKHMENRDDDVTCMIAVGNIYQVSTVKLVRESLSANLTATMQIYLKINRKLSRLQRHIRQDQSFLYDNLMNADGL